MSVELMVRIRRDVPMQALVDLMNHRTASLFAPSRLDWGSVQPADATIGPHDFCVTVSADDREAGVQLLSFFAGPPAVAGDDEGGWWLDVGVVHRNYPSIMLVFVAAACAATLLGEPVFDDSHLLGRGREVPPGVIWELVGPPTAFSLSEAAAQMLPKLVTFAL